MLAPVLAGAHPLVHLNATLNTVATVLLVLSAMRIKQGRESAHGRLMVAAFAVSTLFLISYLTYHTMVGRVDFTQTGWPRLIYYPVLISHVILAATVPVLAILSLRLGAKSLGWLSAAEPAVMREKHRRLVKWAYPIWLYVSVTGVAVYLMLYHIWPPEGL
ncbi:MAG: DUF420 domain-containing protein [Planctomycetota bacterium]